MDIVQAYRCNLKPRGDLLSFVSVSTRPARETDQSTLRLVRKAHRRGKHAASGIPNEPRTTDTVGDALGISAISHTGSHVVRVTGQLGHENA